MENTELLLDSYVVEGNSLEEFYKVIDEMCERTGLLEIRGSDLTFLSMYKGENVQADDKSDNERTPFYYITDLALNKFEKSNNRFEICLVNNSEFDPALIEELRETTGLALFIQKNDVSYKVMVGRASLKTFLQRADLGGFASFNMNNIFRDVHLAASIFDKDEKMKLVYRNVDNSYKMFAAISASYPFVPQSILTDVMKDDDFCFKDYTLKHFKVNNFIAEIILQAPSPDAETGIYPGVMVVNSDVGQSSFAVRSVFITKDSYVINEKCEHLIKHDGNFTPSKIMKVFETVKRELESCDFIQEMAKLKEIPLTVDVPMPDNCMMLEEIAYKTEAANTLISDAISQVYGGTMPRIGVKRLESELSGRLYGAMEYTYFDMAKLLINASAFFPNLDDSTNLKYRRLAYHVPYKILELTKK